MQSSVFIIKDRFWLQLTATSSDYPFVVGDTPSFEAGAIVKGTLAYVGQKGLVHLPPVASPAMRKPRKFKSAR